MNQTEITAVCNCGRRQGYEAGAGDTGRVGLNFWEIRKDESDFDRVCVCVCLRLP